MTKKWLIVGMLLLLTLPAALWSQQSLESQTSFELFENVFDAAFDVSDAGPLPTFSTLEKNYLFGGLANFPIIPNIDSFVGVPLMVGYYKAGTMPWSALSDILIDTTRSSNKNGIAPGYSTKVVGTTTYTWTSLEVDSQYDFLQAWDTSIGGQFLIGLGAVNTGLSFTWDREQNVNGIPIDFWADSNLTTTRTYYYDTAGIGVAPSPAKNYVHEEKESYPDTESTIEVNIPAYVPLGAMGLEVSLNAAIYSRDESWSYVESYTAPQAPGLGQFNSVNDDSTTDKTGYFAFDLDSVLAMEPFWGSHPDNRFDLGLNGGIKINTAGTYEDVDIDQDYDYAGSGAPLVLTNNGTTTDDTTTRERKGTLEYDVNVSAQHYLYFDLGEPVTFGLAPRAEVGVGYTPAFGNYNTEQEVVIKIDNDGDGVYTNVLDRIITTTTTYSNNDDGGDFDINVRTYLPTAIKFRPPGSFFGFTVGNELGLGCTVRLVKDNRNTSKETEVTVDGTGAPVSTAETTEGDSYERKSTTTIWSFSSNFNFALNFYLSENATVDVVVDQYGGDFALYIQGIIAL